MGVFVSRAEVRAVHTSTFLPAALLVATPLNLRRARSVLAEDVVADVFHSNLASPTVRLNREVTGRCR
jgi:hypothetical protein